MTGEVTLRDVQADDLPLFYEHQRDPAALRMAGFPGREWEPFSQHWARILADESIIKQTILLDGQVAGSIVCYEQDGLRQVGYWLGKAFWGRGVGSRALAEFLGLVRVRPLYARLSRHNFASLRLLEKCGFSLAGEVVDSRGAEAEELTLVLRGECPGDPV